MINTLPIKLFILSKSSFTTTNDSNPIINNNKKLFFDILKCVINGIKNKTIDDL